MIAEEAKGTAVESGIASSTESSISLSPSPKYHDSTFDTTEDPRYYKPVPEYEGYHRWDPQFEWEEEEERKIVKKVSPPTNFALIRTNPPD